MAQISSEESTFTHETQTPRITVAFGLSCLLHAFLLALPHEPHLLRIPSLRAQTDFALHARLRPITAKAAPVPAQAEPIKAAQPIPKVSPPRRTSSPQQLPVKPLPPTATPRPELPIPTQPSDTPQVPPPVTPLVAESAPTPAASATPGIATATPQSEEQKPQLSVREIYPEEAASPIDIVDPSYDWHDLSTLWRRPLVLNAPDLVVSGVEDLPADTPAVQLCIRINADGSLQGIQILTPPSALADLLVHTLSTLRFSPGESRPGHPVASLLILEFALTR